MNKLESSLNEISKYDDLYDYESLKRILKSHNFPDDNKEYVDFQNHLKDKLLSNFASKIDTIPQDIQINQNGVDFLIKYASNVLKEFDSAFNEEKISKEMNQQLGTKNTENIRLVNAFEKVCLDNKLDSMFDEVMANAEIENVALYDELFSKVDNQDIIRVFTSLRDASENKNLSAFQRCAGK